MTRFTSYIICATPRSGSTLLCGLLSATGLAGKPASYFHLPSVASWSEDLDLMLPRDAADDAILRATLIAIQRAGTANTGVFGLRLMRMSFDFLMTQLATLHPGLPTDAARFHAAFGRTLYIHLKRDDTVAQAVSRVKAEQTGLWHKAPDGTEVERLAPPMPPSYDAAEISRHVQELTDYNRDWNNWFDQESIDPLRITYEQLATDPAATVARILRRLGQDAKAAQWLKPTVAKLADDISQNWVARYKAEHSAGGTRDP